MIVMRQYRHTQEILVKTDYVAIVKDIPSSSTRICDTYTSWMFKRTVGKSIYDYIYTLISNYYANVAVAPWSGITRTRGPILILYILFGFFYISYIEKKKLNIYISNNIIFFFIDSRLWKFYRKFVGAGGREGGRKGGGGADDKSLTLR